jgi:hypothetical protein
MDNLSPMQGEFQMPSAPSPQALQRHAKSLLEENNSSDFQAYSEKLQQY